MIRPDTGVCNAYKAAYQAYINALKPFNGCNAWTSQQKKEFQDALAEAEDELDGLCDD